VLGVFGWFLGKDFKTIYVDVVLYLTSIIIFLISLDHSILYFIIVS
jgi:hypothetical protein